LPGAIWAPVSAVIVTQPELHPSFKASLLRVVTNLIGAFIGAAVHSVIDKAPLALAIGVVLTGLACHFAKLGDATRTAYAAVVIVTLSTEPHAWAGSMDRVFGVTLGCVAAIAVGIVFDRASSLFPAKTKHGHKHHRPSKKT